MKIDVLQIVDGRMGGESVAALGIHECAKGARINSCVILFYPGGVDSKLKISKSAVSCIKVQLPDLGIFNAIAIYNILRRLINKSLLVHVHGIWPLYSLVGFFICKKFKINFFISPHGSLEKWSLNYKKLKKKIGILAIKKLLKSANSFFVTSIDEAESVGKVIGDSVEVINHTLGVDLEPVSRKIDSYENKNILFVSRVSPKKGVDIIIKAFIRTGRKDWQLTIVGPSEPVYLIGLKKLVGEEYFGNINFLGPLEKNKINELYKRTSFFVLATHSENFGFVIAEALAFKLPVLTTTNTPWNEINENLCGYWIENGVDNFAKYMNKMMQLSPEALKTMGNNGYKLINEKYSWQIATKNIISKYKLFLSSFK